MSAGLAGGADIDSIPERPFDLGEVCAHLRRRHLGGHLFSIVVVAEGAQPVEGTTPPVNYPVDERGFPRFGGIAHLIAPEIERLTGFETRVTVLGHVQRGGSPVAEDWILATRFGATAVDVARRGSWGVMVALHGGAIIEVPLEQAAKIRQVPEELYPVAEVFFD